MARKASPRPTDAELTILRVLWGLGPSTVRQVHDELSKQESTGYTTVLKMLQIMTDKGLVARDASQRAHIYRPLHTQDHTQQHLVGDLLDRAFEGSTSRLLMQALAARPASSQERLAIRQLLDDLDERSTPENPASHSDDKEADDHV